MRLISSIPRAVVTGLRLILLKATRAHRLGYVRPYVAHWWRRFARTMWIVLGFAIFIGLQLWLADVISKWWWWYVIAFVVISGTLVLALRSPIVALIAWSIVSPLGRHFLRLNTGSAALPPISFDLIAIYTLGAILLARRLINRRPQRKLIPGEWLLLAFALYVTGNQLLTIQSLLPTEIMRPFIKVLIPEVFFVLVLYFVVKAAVERKEHVVWVCVGMSVFGLILALSAFYEHFTGERWYSLIVGFGIPLAWEDVGKGRATGMFDSAAAPAALIATVVFLTLHLAGHTRRPAARSYYYASMVVMVVGAYYTYTRNVYVCLILFALIVACLAAGGRRRFAVVALLLAVAVALTLPRMLADPKLNYRILNKENIEERLLYAKTAMNVFGHYPVFGVGWGNFGEVQYRYAASIKSWNKPSRGRLGWLDISHNSYLTLLAEEGLAGTLLYLGSVFAFLVRALAIRARSPAKGFLGKDLVSIFIVSSIVFLFSITAISIYNVPYIHFVLWLQFALVVRMDELAKQEQESEHPKALESIPGALAACQ